VAARQARSIGEARRTIDEPGREWAATVWIVSNPSVPRVEINGHTATAEELRAPALVNYGHLTVMEVRGRKARGLELHLARLAVANQELYGAGLDGDRVRDAIRHALGDIDDASVRVTVFWPETDEAPSIMVIVRPPAEMPGAPQSLQSVRYQRPLAHIKHVGTFGQIHYGLLAERGGFDDALLTGPDGVISEGAIANIGFFDGTGVIWPDAPALHGITMQLLEPRLAGGGLSSRRGTVRLSDLPSFAAAFVTNSRGVAPVGRVDDLPLPVDDDLMTTLAHVYESVPWDPI
jgi:branched-subunit amino acid aminotransferase/4-amino-4-deoxychorismate lyase